MSLSYRDLMDLSTDDLISQHDQIAVHTSVGVNYFLEELRRREQNATNRLLVRLTIANAALAALTVVVATLTLILTT